MANPKPVTEIRIGAVKASVWRNATDNGPRFNATFSRIYRDSEGDWKSTSSFSRDDLLTVAKVADRAHTKIFELQRQEKQQARTNQAVEPAPAAHAAGAR